MPPVTSTMQIQDDLVDALIATGLNLWKTSHNNTLGAHLVYQWMRDVTPGHFVLEVTSTGRTSSRPMDRIGVLVSIQSRHEYTIRTVDGRELRWENAAFVRIPRNEFDNREIFLLGFGEQNV